MSSTEKTWLEKTHGNFFRGHQQQPNVQYTICSEHTTLIERFPDYISFDNSFPKFLSEQGLIADVFSHISEKIVTLLEAPLTRESVSGRKDYCNSNAKYSHYLRLLYL